MTLLRRAYTIGVDEVGRGPIAGPVAVCAFVCLDPKVKRYVRGVRESKQLSEAQREEWFTKIRSLQKAGLIDFHVSFRGQSVIDTHGITHAINKCLTKSLRRLCDDHAPRLSPAHVRVLLDGGLKAPEEFVRQKTIIKGDEREYVIALASICAKVLRDRRMRALAQRHPEYGFDMHKGYGTKMHYGAIRKYGLLPVHRKSFL